MRIIITNKTKKHMKVHEEDFIINWNKLVEKCNDTNVFKDLNKDFEIKTIYFEENIGYSSLVKVTDEDEVVYAKRKKRSIYTKFVRNKEKKLVQSAVFVLDRKKNNKNLYFLVTMFPGVENYKEPEDFSIKNDSELRASLDFWANHALVFDENTIKDDTLTTECPYKDLYMSLH